MTNYNDGKWHGWNGGECPVHPKTEVTIATGAGKTTDDAGEFVWDGPDCYGNQIIVFRVVKEYREPREWWTVDGEMFDSIEMAQEEIITWAIDVKEIIHVREVME